MKLIIKQGTTSKLQRIFVTDSSKTDGSGLTGLVHNTASLTAYYIREGAAATTAITLVDAVVGTYTSSGFKEVDAANMPGIYELHPPNAVLASGADSVLIFLKGASNMAALPIEIQLDDNTAKDVYDRIGAPAGVSIAADLVTIEGHTDKIDDATDGLTAIKAEVEGLGGAAMRGTDGANTTVPDAAGTAPTAAEIKTEIEQAGSTLAQILEDTGTSIPADTAVIYDVLVKVKTTVSISNHASSFTITGGAAIYAAYRGMTMSITDASDGHDEVRRIKSYSSGRVVVLDRALGFTPAVGDIVEIMNGFADVNLLAIKDSDGTASNFEDDYDGTGYAKANSTIGTCTTNTDMVAEAPTAVENAIAVWDRILTGATHNITTSAGRRVREIGAYAIASGTAQGGNSHSITLAAADTAGDNIYNRNLIVITDNTGVGQTRTIVGYDGTSKVAVVDRDWYVQPDATTEYQITPDDTPLVVDHGVARGGTPTTITLRALASAGVNNYLCSIVTIIAGTGQGQARLVGSYDGTTKVVTICGDNWSTTPDTTSVYVLMPYGAACASCIPPSVIAEISDGVWDEDLTGHSISKTAGWFVKKIKAIVDAIHGLIQ